MNKDIVSRIGNIVYEIAKTVVEKQQKDSPAAGDSSGKIAGLVLDNIAVALGAGDKGVKQTSGKQGGGSRGMGSGRSGGRCGR